MVLIGGAPATVVDTRRTTIVVRTPPGSGQASVVVLGAAGEADTVWGAFRYYDPALGGPPAAPTPTVSQGLP